ncbi:hypothetical protein WICPIJ_004625 [Wickerhamomyces pijperi]|uniref:Guanine nucleotide-binding protein subunit beta n=1 Tax=Wickerhamomyces pijperi TaxID=599730 RepID=A0A9P8Q7J1_WICPI|nr:hypothetical protein WICPIJ_004625 [Wickerhamomyces pijperi]
MTTLQQQYNVPPSPATEGSSYQDQLNQKISQARFETKQLYNQIDKIKGKIQDTTLTDCSKDIKSLSSTNINLKTCQVLKGHNNKIADFKWSADSKTILSCSQDGFLIIWDAVTGFKVNAIPLDSQWVLSCAYSPNSKMVASAGLTNNCTIYSIGNHIDDQRILTVFKGHTVGISQCEFLNNQEILTASGDMTCKLWDISRGMKTVEFLDHYGDVLSMNVNRNNNTSFVTGSSDGYTRVFDIRSTAKTNLTSSFFVGNSDVTSAQFFKDGNSIVTGSDDGVIRLYDLRSDCELAKFSLASSLHDVQLKQSNQTAFFNQQNNNYTSSPISPNFYQKAQQPHGMLGSPGLYNSNGSSTHNRFSSPSFQDQNSQIDSSGVTSLDFSASGRLMYACYTDYGCIIWDFLKNEIVGKLEGHSNRVTKVATSPNGFGVCTSSWDSTMRLWTPSYI